MDKNELINFLKQGYSTREIARETGLHHNTISYWINKYDIREFMQHKSQKRAISFKKIDSREKAYILGFILADGYINEKNDVDIKISLNDKEVIDFISDNIKSEISISTKFDKKSRTFPSVRTHRRIKDILTFTGGRLKEDRHYPIIKNDLERYMLLGFFDADGCITWGKRKDRDKLWMKVSFTSQLKLLTGIQQMLYKIGISSIIRPKANEKCYIIEFSNKQDILKFINYIYPKNSDFIILKRKYLKANALRLELEEFGETTNI